MHLPDPWRPLSIFDRLWEGTMSSTSRWIENLDQLPTAFWLPPGGKANGVEAAQWVVLADLEADDVAEVLNMLAHAGIGGYAALLSGQGVGKKGTVCHRLWVDTMQLHGAEEVLMSFLRHHSSQMRGAPLKRKSTDGSHHSRPDHTGRSQQADRRCGVVVYVRKAPDQPNNRIGSWWWDGARGVARLVPRYLVAMLAGLGLYWRFFARRHLTPLACLLAATAGVVAMAVVEMRICGRYILGNHAEAKRRRRREAQRKLPEV
jgi:hypothetical protein